MAGKFNKYQIILFCNKKKVKTIYTCNKRSTVYEHWREHKTQQKPPYVKLRGGRRNDELVYELALIFPMTRWVDKVWVKDSLGRNVEAVMKDTKYRIKEIIPYWYEELIYDFENKKRIRYHEMMNQIYPITEIAQIFSLNNKIFVQVEDKIRLFGNKNIFDTERLFEIIKQDLLKRKRGNFIFVKDVSRHQRSLLYRLLESKGYKREELFRHYSY